jgi:methylated-DNA-[protein]-cysteine S-methyltransferase
MRDHVIGTVEAGAGAAIQLKTDTIDSEIGPIVIVTDSRALCALDFGDCEERMKELLTRRFEEIVLRQEANPLGVSEKVHAYLAGNLHALDGVAVDPGGTEFQRTVWTALRMIPVGTTRTYGQLAASIGRPTASRAVGLANSLNPVAIAIPCHRVIGSNASLTGYAGGLQRKQWLLRHEGVLLWRVIREHIPPHLDPSPGESVLILAPGGENEALDRNTRS